MACLLLATASLTVPAAAVPIPWRNCGTPTDLLSIQKWDASVWPPTVAAPVNATATLDGSGHVRNLHVYLVHGPAWSFDSGPLPSNTNGGFVSLPASFPVNLTSPPLPLLAGPYNTLYTFPGEGATSVTVASRANLGAQLTPPLSTTLSLATNGTPGFPLTSVASTVYEIRVQMTEQDGTGVFCLDLLVPMKTAAALVDVVSESQIPALSQADLAILVLLLAGCGVLAAGTGKS